MIGVYKITNKVNGKYYIGSSKDIQKRFNSHITDLDNGTHNNTYLQRSWDKYGKDNFEFTILEETSLDDLRNRETYYIKEFDATNHNVGYNMLNDANIGLGVSASDEVRAKISEACKGTKNGHYGKKHSEETKARISEAKKLKAQQRWLEEKHFCENCGKLMAVKFNRTGRFCSNECSNEHKSKMQSLHMKGKSKPDGFGEKLSKSLTGRKLSVEHCKHISDNAKQRLSDPSNNPMYGKKHSDKTKQKISQTLKSMDIESSRFAGHKHSEESKQKISESLYKTYYHKKRGDVLNDKQ